MAKDLDFELGLEYNEDEELDDDSKQINEQEDNESGNVTFLKTFYIL